MVVIFEENRFVKTIKIETELLETEIIGHIAYFEYISNIIYSRFRTIVTYYYFDRFESKRMGKYSNIRTRSSHIVSTNSFKVYRLKLF